MVTFLYLNTEASCVIRSHGSSSSTSISSNTSSNDFDNDPLFISHARSTFLLSSADFSESSIHSASSSATSFRVVGRLLVGRAVQLRAKSNSRKMKASLPLARVGARSAPASRASMSGSAWLDHHPGVDHGVGQGRGYMTRGKNGGIIEKNLCCGGLRAAGMFHPAFTTSASLRNTKLLWPAIVCSGCFSLKDKILSKTKYAMPRFILS